MGRPEPAAASLADLPKGSTERPRRSPMRSARRERIVSAAISRTDHVGQRMRDAGAQPDVRSPDGTHCRRRRPAPSRKGSEDPWAAGASRGGSANGEETTSPAPVVPAAATAAMEASSSAPRPAAAGMVNRRRRLVRLGRRRAGPVRPRSAAVRAKPRRRRLRRPLRLVIHAHGVERNDAAVRAGFHVGRLSPSAHRRTALTPRDVRAVRQVCGGFGHG